jgi:hypothetical protein
MSGIIAVLLLSCIITKEKFKYCYPNTISRCDQLQTYNFKTTSGHAREAASQE